MGNKISLWVISVLGRTVLLVSILLAPSAALAALDTEAATRQVNRPFNLEAEEKLRPPPTEGAIPVAPPAKPEVVQGPSFLLQKVTLKGVQSLPESLFTPLIAKYEGREVSFSELQTLAHEIQTLYLEKGLIAACFMPPQDIKDGEVVLQVVETRMGELQTKEHKYFRKKILERYWRVHKGEILRYHKISRALQLMNKNPDRSVRADLRAGKEPGTTDVLLDVETRRPFHVSLSSDHEGAASTGRQRTTVGMRHNNFLGWDDTLLVGYTLSHHSDGKYAYHRLPLNACGTSLMYGYSYSKSHPKKEYTPLELNSLSRTASVSLSQDLYQDNHGSGEVSLGFDAKDTRTTMFSGTSTHDRLRILKAGGNFTFKSDKQDLGLSPSLSQGLNGLGARDRSEYASRDADNVFTKANLDAVHRISLPWRMSLVSRLGVQAASRRLPSPEAYSLGGINSVRGYPDGDRIADNALQGNFDLLFPLSFVPEKMRLPWSPGHSLRPALSGVVFFDKAVGEQRVAKGTENRTANLQSVGAGLRLQLEDKVFIRTEWGFPTGDDPLTGHRSSRLHFSFEFEY